MHFKGFPEKRAWIKDTMVNIYGSLHPKFEVKVFKSVTTKLIGISLTHSLLELYFRTLFNWTVKNIPSFSLIPPRHFKSKCRLLATNDKWFISTGTIFWMSHTSEHDFSWKSSIKIIRETPRKARRKIFHQIWTLQTYQGLKLVAK